MRTSFRKLLALTTLMALPLTACTKKEGGSTSSEGSASSSAAPAGDVIKIGEVGSMTGGQASFGVATHNGIMLAVDQINAQGGVKGKKLAVISVDDQSKPEEAATAMTKLITQDKVVAVLGEVASTNSLAMAPIAQNNKIPMISPSSTNPEVTKKGNYIFRVCFIDPFQGTVMAKFAHDTLKAKTVALLTDISSDYSKGLGESFVQTFEKLGGKIVVKQSYAQGDRDFSAQLTDVKGKNPDVIFVPGYYREVALIARKARELGMKQPLLGGDGWDAPELIQQGGPAMNGNYFSNHYSADKPDPAAAGFIKNYKTKYGIDPDGLAAMGYDAAAVLADAMKRAPSLSPSDIRDAIAQTKDFPGVTGKITINSQRDAEKAAVVLKIEDGKFKYQATVNP